MSIDRQFMQYRPHPWHGLDAGPKSPEIVVAYIEITPFDTVKYEIDKVSGYLKVDRPQRNSSLPPALYGFIPRTYCDVNVAALSPHSTRGDRDPLDICVLSERPISRSEVLLNARVVGGIQMIDHGEADDKIVAVLENDNIWGDISELSDLPSVLVERLTHYFRTYKLTPGVNVDVKVDDLYGAQHAYKVIGAAMTDYVNLFESGNG